MISKTVSFKLLDSNKKLLRLNNNKDNLLKIPTTASNSLDKKFGKVVYNFMLKNWKGQIRLEHVEVV